MLNLKPENGQLVRDVMGFGWNLTKITPADLDRLIDAAREQGAQPKTPKTMPILEACPQSRARLDGIARQASKIVDGPCKLTDIRRVADLISMLASAVEPRSRT